MRSKETNLIFNLFSIITLPIRKEKTPIYSKSTKPFINKITLTIFFSLQIYKSKEWKLFRQTKRTKSGSAIVLETRESNIFLSLLEFLCKTVSCTFLLNTLFETGCFEKSVKKYYCVTILLNSNIKIKFTIHCYESLYFDNTYEYNNMIIYIIRF